MTKMLTSDIEKIDWAKKKYPFWFSLVLFINEIWDIIGWNVALKCDCRDFRNNYPSFRSLKLVHWSCEVSQEDRILMKAISSRFKLSWPQDHQALAAERSLQELPNAHITPLLWSRAELDWIIFPSIPEWTLSVCFVSYWG